MEKQILRELVYEKTGQLAEDYIAAAGERIEALVLESEAFLQAKTVFVFMSTGMEPDTAQIIKAARKLGKRVCVPKCRKKPFMDAVVFSDATRFEPGFFGILEPVAGDVCPPAEIDLVIVPCVAASSDGRRLGHGAGYYDAFLKLTGAARLCLCFSELLRDDIPVDENDVKMDVIVTEKGILQVG